MLRSHLNPVSCPQAAVQDAVRHAVWDAAWGAVQHAHRGRPQAKSRATTIMAGIASTVVTRTVSFATTTPVS